MDRTPPQAGVWERLQQAWNTRFNRDFHKCREQVRELQHELGVKVLNGGNDFTLGANPSTETVETVLLLISLFRADGKPNVCREWLSRLETYCHEQGIALPFQFHFQTGISAYAEGEYPPALDSFLTARPLATTSLERLSCVGNLVLCLEALGLSFEKSIDEFYEEVEKLQSAPPYLADLLSQIRALEMRGDYRNGSFDRALSHGPVPTVSQAAYLSLWIKELPFHRYFKKMPPAALEAFLVAEGSLYSRPVRLRTIQGIPHDSDLATARPSEVADRLYLWIWRWLANPSEVSTESLAAALPLLKDNAVLSRMTCEDLQLVRNGLLWLALFSQFSEDRWRQIQSHYGRNAPDYPLFELEKRGLDYLHARLVRPEASGETWNHLVAHPLWGKEQLRFQEIFESAHGQPVAQDPFQELSQALARLAPVVRHESRFTVDLVHKVLHPPDAQPVYSESLCRGIDLLREKGSVTAGQFVFHAFGLPRFDAEIHNPKIFNLLSRMKALQMGDIQFKYKAEVVHAEGTWPEVDFHRPHPMTELLLQCEPWLAFWSPTPEPTPRNAGGSLNKVLEIAQMEKNISRELVQKELEVSRATATRLLRQCVEQGLLEKLGSAKNTRYTLAQEEAHP